MTGYVRKVRDDWVEVCPQYHDKIFIIFFFFFQAEDGIRDTSVTGVQTCALPIFHAKNKKKCDEWLLRKTVVKAVRLMYVRTYVCTEAIP